MISAEQLKSEIAEEILASCQACSYSFTSMFWQVCQEHVLPTIRELGADGRIGRIETDLMHIQTVTAWNSLMPDPDDPDAWLHAAERSTWQWIPFGELFLEKLKTSHPSVVEDSNRVKLDGFRKDEDMRERAIEAIIHAVTPFMIAGVIKPVATNSTVCKRTGEQYKFGMVRFRPVLFDMNDNRIDLRKREAEADHAPAGPG